MSARDEIFKRLAGAFIPEDRANALIDAYAHELAEKIRYACASWGAPPRQGQACDACERRAAVIDPEVTT